MASRSTIAAILGMLAVTVGPNVETSGATIDGPSTADVGQLVILRSNEPANWLLLPAGEDFWVDPTQQHAAFSARRPGVYQFALIGGVKDGIVQCEATHTLVVGGGPVPPVPPPPPPVPPVPPEPDSDWARWAAAEATKSVPAAVLQSTGAKLAGSMESVCAAAAAGTLASPREAREEMRRSNRASLGKNVDAWEPFSEQLKQELDKLIAKGELTTIDQHVGIWTQIAKGIRAAQPTRKGGAT